jgi:hypothetical protein
MRRRTHGRQSVEERLEDASLAQAIEALPHAVPMTEALRQRAPANVLDSEEMQRLEEAPIVLSFPSPTRQAGPKHRKRVRLGDDACRRYESAVDGALAIGSTRSPPIL